jgi:repressor LexA
MDYLTRRQQETLRAIERFRARRGYAPSLDELRKILGLRSVATVHKHVTALEAKGRIRRLRRRSRALEPVAASSHEPLTILGRIAAGQPLEAVPAPESLALPWQGREDVFVLEVRGESMIEEQIRSGDYIIVGRRDTAEDGQVVVALVDGQEATLKRFRREKDGRVRLEPANSSMEPIILPAERVRVQGVVLGVLRKYR